MHQTFNLNELGRDFIVGDIHGCFSRLQVRLNKIGFDPTVDRLFSVGDLVDRGPESDQALDWLAKPWFHAVRGNHEQMAIDHVAGYSDKKTYIVNGGEWLIALPYDRQIAFAKAFSALPLAITLHTDAGPVGIVHADCPTADWSVLVEALRTDAAEQVGMLCMWNRDRITFKQSEHIAGVRAVIVGHTCVTEWITMGNVIFIDTGAMFDGNDFTILAAATLIPIGQNRT